MIASSGVCPYIVDVIYTIGHSNQTFESLLALLRQYGIEELIDVRSSPVSQYAPHFNKIVLEKQLPQHAITYRYMGEELGGRPAGGEFYDARGFVLYGKMARSFAFRQGIDRLLMESGQLPSAIMCSEENPAVCHRHLLIARVLTKEGVEVQHIRGNGAIQSYQGVVKEASGTDESLTQSDLFDTSGDEQWKSLRSVLRENQPGLSSGY